MKLDGKGGESIPMVSVIIPMCNEVRYIERCLALLLAQDYPPNDYEILVVEGLSDDDSADIVCRLVGEHPAD